jgi:hypothetical protein
MKTIPLVSLALLAAGNVGAETPERSLPLDAVKLETIRIEGQVQTWVMDKICLDGQAYLIVLGTRTPTAIAPAFKDGKPERCALKTAK